MRLAGNWRTSSNNHFPLKRESHIHMIVQNKATPMQGGFVAFGAILLSSFGDSIDLNLFQIRTYCR